MHIELLTYNVTLRHPGAVNILKGIKPKIMGNAFEGFADAERAQVYCYLFEHRHISILLYTKTTQSNAFNYFTRYT